MLGELSLIGQCAEASKSLAHLRSSLAKQDLTEEERSQLGRKLQDAEKYLQLILKSAKRTSE